MRPIVILPEQNFDGQPKRFGPFVWDQDVFKVKSIVNSADRTIDGKFVIIQIKRERDDHEIAWCTDMVPGTVLRTNKFGVVNPDNFWHVDQSNLKGESLYLLVRGNNCRSQISIWTMIPGEQDNDRGVRGSSGGIGSTRGD